MPTVLLIDDSPLVRLALGRRLVAEGFAVREAQSVQSARASEASATVAPACAVLDLQLPDGDGTVLAAALAAKHPGIPVAFFTAGGVPSLVECARGRGPVFLKPDDNLVIAWVKRVLRPS
ncbi:MAG: response regulator [Polyangiaceae bacterium]|jgi:two-component system, OmpR family, response regulator